MTLAPLLCGFLFTSHVIAVTEDGASISCAADQKDCDAAGGDVVELLQHFSDVKKTLNHAETSRKSSQKQEPIVGPTVLITGTGDSGTRGIARAYQEMGMYFCESCKNEVEDNMPSFEIGLEYFYPLLLSGGGKIDPAGYKSSSAWDPTMRKLEDTMVNTTTQMLAENSSLSFEGLNWGIKVPSHFYLLPVYDEVFNHSVKYLMVARDPRDACTNDNQRNFHLYGPYLAGTKNGTDCWRFYSAFWTTVFNNYEFDPMFKVVRVEDLVVPEPTGVSPVLNCMADFAGLSRPSPELAVDILSEAHEHNDSYMGHHYNMTDEERASTEAELFGQVKHDKQLQTVLSKLGYGFEHYELKTPTSSSVCK
mmetsp:Transcript_46122/g.86424  ORF Transcript_46122/g.86424 Transcript_46122/m.86424 type:complete len:364 (-) Transcript_46122:33-1124(-)